MQKLCKPIYTRIVLARTISLVVKKYICYNKDRMLAKIKKSWFIVGLIGILLGAPNALVIRYVIVDEDPFLFNALRFLLIALITLPIIIRYRKSFTKSNFKYALVAALAMSVAVTAFVWAVKLSQASYVSIFTLIVPIILIFYSARFNKEKITSRAVAGITLAAAGAMTIVVLPVTLSQNGEFIFYPAATAIIALNLLAFPAAIVALKKANEGGTPMMPLVGFMSWVIFVVSAICVLLFTDIGQATQIAQYDNSFIFSVLYSGIAVGLLSRVLSTKSYEHIGSAATGALGYLESLIAILLPVFILGEILSTEMVIGGILILLGLYIVEHHKHTHHKHHILTRHH